MRRVIVAIALLVLLGATAVAVAKTTVKPKDGVYQGKATSKNGTGTYVLSYRSFEKRVQLSSWAGKLKCADGSETTGGGTILQAPLKGTKFTATRKTSSTSLKLTGKFTASTKMTGTVRYKTDGPAPSQQCDTGTIAFSAKYKKGAQRVVAAKKKIKPKAGGYSGQVTNKNGKGKISMVYATFDIGGKDRKAMQLFNWTAILKCDDGTTTEGTMGVTSPLKGVKFSGKATQGQQTVTFSGRWTSNTKVTGSARLKTTGPQKCDSGPVTYSVKHT